MTSMISDPIARDNIVAAIRGARSKGQLGGADGAISKTLKAGRKALFVRGSGIQIALIPNDAFHGCDVLRFYGADGVLRHEEAAGTDRLAAIGMGE